MFRHLEIIKEIVDFDNRHRSYNQRYKNSIKQTLFVLIDFDFTHSNQKWRQRKEEGYYHKISKILNLKEGEETEVN